MKKSHKLVARILMIAACIMAVVFFVTQSQNSNEAQFIIGLLAGLLLIFTVVVFKKTK